MLKRDLLRNVIIFQFLAAIIIGLRVFYLYALSADWSKTSLLAKNDLSWRRESKTSSVEILVLYMDGKVCVGRVTQEKDQVT